LIVQEDDEPRGQAQRSSLGTPRSACSTCMPQPACASVPCVRRRWVSHACVQRWETWCEKRGSGGHWRDGAARGGIVVGDGTAGVTHPCGLAALAAFGPV